MSNTPARLGDAMAALFTAMTASSALAGVTISYDIPTAEADPEFVILGHDGTLDPDGSLALVTTAATFTLQHVWMGADPQHEENGTINLVAVAQSGDIADLPGRITEVTRLLGACEDASDELRAFPGSSPGSVIFDNADRGRLLTRQTAQGCAAIIPFTISYTAPWG